MENRRDIILIIRLSILFIQHRRDVIILLLLQLHLQQIFLQITQMRALLVIIQRLNQTLGRTVNLLRIGRGLVHQLLAQHISIPHMKRISEIKHQPALYFFGTP